MNNNAKQAAQRERYFALRESTIDNIMNILVSGMNLFYR